MKNSKEKRIELCTERMKELQDAIAVLQKMIDNPDVSEKKITEEMGVNFAKYRRIVYDLDWVKKESDANRKAKKKGTEIYTACWQELLWLDVFGYLPGDLEVAPIDVVETVDAIVGAMKDRLKQTILYYFEEGMDFKEIAETMDITPQYVSFLYKRAKRIITVKTKRLSLGDNRYGTLLGMQRRLEEDMTMKIKAEVLHMLDDHVGNLTEMIKLGYATIQKREEEIDKLKESDEYDLIRLADLNLSTHTLNCLKNAGIMTLGELKTRSRREIAKFRGIGVKTYGEIMDVVSRYNIILEDD